MVWLQSLKELGARRCKLVTASTEGMASIKYILVLSKVRVDGEGVFGRSA